MLSELLATELESVTATKIFDGFIARERLGSTALGDGTAIPHCRIDSIDRIYCAGLKLDTGIDYDSPDNIDVSILFGLIVPTEATDEHLLVLAQLAEFLSKPANRERIRNCETSSQLFKTIVSYANAKSNAA